jgi:hypothetical protein
LGHFLELTARGLHPVFLQVAVADFGHENIKQCEESLMTSRDPITDL